MSVEKRTNSSGKVSWVARFRITDPRTGTWRARSLSRPTKAGAIAAEREALAARDRGLLVEPSRLLVGEYMERWLASKEGRIRESTHQSYRKLVRRHIIPRLGHIPLQKLLPAGVQHWEDTLLTSGGIKRAGGAAPGDVRACHGLLRQALAHAVALGLVVRNATDGVKPPSRPAVEQRVWTKDQVKHFLASTVDDPLHLLWRVALETGARRGELLALHWEHVDTDSRQIHIRHALSDSNGVLKIREPKTRSGKRAIPITAHLADRLDLARTEQKRRRLAAGPGWEEHDLVFCGKWGGMLWPNNISTQFHALIRAHHMPPIRLHDLRHTNATLLLADRVPIKEVSERLGHSDIAMTLRIYAHVIPGEEQAVASIANLFY